MRYLMCSAHESEEKCSWAFAIVYDKSTIDIVRKKQKFTITGSDVNILGTCPRCDAKTTVIIKNGELQENELTILDKESYDEQVKKAKEARQGNSGDDDPEGEPDNDPDEQPDNDTGVSGSGDSEEDEPAVSTQPSNFGKGKRTYTVK